MLCVKIVTLPPHTLLISFTHDDVSFVMMRLCHVTIVDHRCHLLISYHSIKPLWRLTCTSIMNIMTSLTDIIEMTLMEPTGKWSARNRYEALCHLQYIKMTCLLVSLSLINILCFVIHSPAGSSSDPPCCLNTCMCVRACVCVRMCAHVWIWVGVYCINKWQK